MITDFLNIDLVKEFGLEGISEEKKSAINAQLSELFGSRLSIAVLARLNEEQKTKLDAVMDADGDVMAFYKENMPEFDILSAEVLADIKRETAQLFAGVQDAIDKSNK